MKRSSKICLFFTIIFCLLLLNSCKPKIVYPNVDQLQIIDKSFLVACNTVIDNANRINEEHKQSNFNYYINSFVIRIWERNKVICFQFVYGNDTDINEAVSDSYITYGYFCYKKNTFLVQYDTNRRLPELFKKAGKQAKVSFVWHVRKPFFSKLFKEKYVVTTYDPIYTSFQYINGEFVIWK